MTLPLAIDLICCPGAPKKSTPFFSEAGLNAFKEVYSKKTLKNTKKVISNQNYKKWGWPTDGQPINAFNPASEKKGVDFFKCFWSFNFYWVTKN